MTVIAHPRILKQIGHPATRGRDPYQAFLDQGPEGLRPFPEARVNPGRFAPSVHKSDNPSNSQMCGVAQIGVGKLSFCVDVQR